MKADVRLENYEVTVCKFAWVLKFEPEYLSYSAFLAYMQDVCFRIQGLNCKMPEPFKMLGKYEKLAEHSVNFQNFPSDDISLEF